MEISNVGVVGGVNSKSCYMQKFRLYETRSRFYMIGRDKNKTFWRVLKIDRLEASELNIVEDSTLYTETEYCDILRCIHEGNKSTGGLKFITNCYGIIGFIKFLEPYYMLIITNRKKIGKICGHSVYAITKSEMVPIPHPSVRSKLAYAKDENRYKKLLCSMDLTKDFFYSYSYNIMLSLQKNLCGYNSKGKSLYETLFVWNEFLTRGIRNNLQNTSWTVALVYGYFKQVNLSISGHKFNMIIIARRSRHYAGTRYLKRGVNEKGRVANDVETEQIVFADASDGSPMQISSVVQIRGSIPLFWSQEASPLNIRPDIILSHTDSKFEATRLHFDNLVERYGKPIIILNLIKTHEKKPRETLLRTEFVNAVNSINQNLSEDACLRFLHLDLHRQSRRSKATNVLLQLGKVAAIALDLTGIFYFPVTPNTRLEGLFPYSYSGNNNVYETVAVQNSISKFNVDKETKVGNCDYNGDDENKDYNVKPKTLQSGVLRTNCIDCLDRTNIAQFAYGLVALGRQLQMLGFIEDPDIDLDNPLAKEVMKAYESMGDTLAFQYGGSAAHNKIFSERRGQWKAAAQSQELIRIIQRYYNNTCLDGAKQKAINIFLGHFQPQQGKPALWELDSDQYCDIGSHGPNLADGVVGRSLIRRSQSDYILGESDAAIRNLHAPDCQHSSENPDKRSCLESTSDTFTCESSICHCWKIYGGMGNDQYCESDHICYEKHKDACDSSNFLDVDWLSSSGNSCEEELLERSISISSDNIVNEQITEVPASESGPILKERESEEQFNKNGKHTDSFENWVTRGEM